jgi:hypothetical protein
MMSSPRPTHPSDRLLKPRFPPELFLNVFLHADRPTLVALCLSSLALLELATPFLYNTAHLDDLPQAATPRTPRIAPLLPRLALVSVRILHLTLPRRPTRRIFPSVDLPKLDHIIIHHSRKSSSSLYFSWRSCDELFPRLNPLSVTFCLNHADEPRSCGEWYSESPEWLPLAWSWARLENVVFRGGELFEGGQRSPLLSDKQALGYGPVRITYDFRAFRFFSSEAFSEEGEAWARYNFALRRSDLLPRRARPILVKTSSEEEEVELVKVLEELGVDQDGLVYRDRVEICQGPEQEGERVLMQMEAWRRRGMDWVKGRVPEQDGSEDDDRDLEDN